MSSIDCSNIYISDEQLLRELLFLDNGNVVINEHRVTGTIEPLPESLQSCIHNAPLSELLRLAVVEVDGVRKLRTVSV